jgi:hypothetical protein
VQDMRGGQDNQAHVDQLAGEQAAPATCHSSHSLCTPICRMAHGLCTCLTVGG